ncbi:MAG: Phospholipase D/competence protein ComEA helix-hairpin-helix domain protein [Parcubacteria group bacterium GW2011_GWF2_43_11]|nr:MAG: Phospholipase D/competence protein ComEA helix-hairpin-helix domain protein [Parcubacteria group bacterium GW2011_GWF2_43_11]
MKTLVLVFFLCFLPLNSIQAASAGDVLINEVAWMGTLTSANDEWIELYNQTEGAISIESWRIESSDGSPKINLTGVIPAQSFWLLERTDDSSVANISADQIYTGALNNNGETLELYNTGELIDSLIGSGAWPAGDNSSWQTSRDAGGTPKAKNSTPPEEKTPRLATLPPTTAQSEITNIEKEPEKDNLPESLAAAGEQIPQTSSFSTIILLVALALAVFSGAMILILKKGLR